jgi:anti-anti-sigma regulatory factor
VARVYGVKRHWGKRVRVNDWGMPPNPPGAIRVVIEGDDLVLHLTGEIDAATVGQYEEAAGRNPSAAAAARPLRVVDAAAVTLMYNLALRVLVCHL